MFLFGRPDIYKLKARRDVRGLIKALRYDREAKDWEIRREAAWALGELREARAVKPLISALQDRKYEVRQAAITALGKIGDPRAVEPLVAALQDKQSWGLRKAAVEALGKIGNTRAVALVVGALTDPQREVCESAVEALKGVGALAVDQLVAALGQQSPSLRKAAAEALGQLGEARAVEPLIAILQDSESSVRAAAARSLEQIGDVRAVEPLIALLQDDKACHAAARALQKIGDSRAVEPLSALLNDRRFWVRESVADALNQLGWQPGQDERAAWYRAIQGDWQKCVSLGKLSIEPLSAVLQELNTETGEAYRDMDSLLRRRYRAAIDSLGKIGGPEVVEPLIRALDKPQWEVRYEAAKRLVHLYQHGNLPEGARQKILEQRERILERPRVDYIDGLEESSGIGVDFPL